MTEIYNRSIPVKTFIQKSDGSISTTSEVINIKIMSETTPSFLESSKVIYLGEFDDYAKYGFGRKYIHVIKYNDNDILIYPSPYTIFGGKKNKTKRNKRKKSKTQKRYL